MPRDGFWQDTACAPFELQPASAKDLGQITTGSSGGAWSACTHLTVYGLNIAPFFIRFLALQLQPQSALEFGCGLGLTADFLARFSPRGARVTCIEPNEMHTEVYQRRSLPQRPTQLALNALTNSSADSRVNACRDTIASAKFDLVYSLEVAEHVPVELHSTLVELLARATGRILVFSASNVMNGVGHLKSSLRTKAGWQRRFEAAGLVHMPRLSALASNMAYPERIDIARDVIVMRASTATDVTDTDVPSHEALVRESVFPFLQPLNYTSTSSHRHYLVDHAKVRGAQRVYESALWPELHALATGGGCNKKTTRVRSGEGRRARGSQ